MITFDLLCLEMRLSLPGASSKPLFWSVSILFVATFWFIMKQQAETEESKTERLERERETYRKEDHKYQVFHTDCSKKYLP